jgi:tetratricopeptide (TPR) repeat protein
VAGFFRLEEQIPVAFRNALVAYEEGRFFAALGDVDEILVARDPAYALDDALFVRALSLVGLGWDDLAVASLTPIIESDPPSPYYVLALLELVGIHERAGRWKAIADAWERHVDRPLRSSGSRNERIADLLFDFGRLRLPITASTRREKTLLSRPEELAVILEKRRERASDRLFYRCGLALFRLGRHGESLRALLMIGIDSPYYPYARYAIAQDLFALGRVAEATGTLARLERYPKITPEERALASRSRILHASILFETGKVERGIEVARSIADYDPEAPKARLLIVTALLDAGKPALALVYDTADAAAFGGAEAKRALTVGAAYASLGDKESAARVLRGAAKSIRDARAGGSEEEGAIDRLRAFAEGRARERHDRERAVRAHVADGIRIVLAHDGPWNLGTLMRRLRAALGAGAYRQLAAGIQPPLRGAVSEGGLSPAYLSSPRRLTTELALDRLAEVDSDIRTTGGETSLRILNAYLLWLEHAPPGAVQTRAARRVVELIDRLRSRSAHEISFRFDPAEPIGPQVGALRRELSENASALSASRPDQSALQPAREEAASLLGQSIDRELRGLLEKRDAELREIEFNLDVALAGTLVGVAPR